MSKGQKTVGPGPYRVKEECKMKLKKMRKKSTKKETMIFGGLTRSGNSTHCEIISDNQKCKSLC